MQTPLNPSDKHFLSGSYIYFQRYQIFQTGQSVVLGGFWDKIISVTY